MSQSNAFPIKGFAIRGYRSFGSDLQYFPRFKKINLLVGPNNCGKSNLLHFIHSQYNRFLMGTNQTALDHEELDKPQEPPKRGVEFALPFSITTLIEDHVPDERFTQVGIEGLFVDNFLNADSICTNQDRYWLRFASEDYDGPLSLEPLAESLHSEDVLPDNEWKRLAGGLGTRKCDEGRDAIEAVLEKLHLPNYHQQLSSVHFIPAIREIDKPSDDFGSFTGHGIIESLAEMQHPGHDNRAKRRRFDEIQEFLRTVTGDSSAELEIPHDRSTIEVQIGDRLLPIEQVGTGIHEVVILAAAATTVTDSVVCIEEPEVHLHPTLQRKLLHYLADHTSNQYFIATHSAHILDIEEAAVYELSMEDGWTKVGTAATDRRQFEAAHNLGYRASDLMQANCVIWVEGPSDRIYLNYWLNRVAPELEEGVHYSILFYGGDLLSHLSAEDAPVDDFVAIQALNRQVALVMDSDRDSKGEQRNKTKRRVENEIEDFGGFVWTTAGREIENYLPDKEIAEALSELDDKFSHLVGNDIYDKAYEYSRGAEKTHKPASKVAMARKVIDKAPELEILDLKSKIEKLANFVRDANSGIYVDTEELPPTNS